MAAPHAIGIDIGGTRLRAALVDRAGTLLARAETPTLAGEGPAAVIAQIARPVEQVGQGATGEGIAGAGVSSPGPIDTVRGLALGVPTLKGWNGVPIADMIAEALDLPVTLENDGIAAANGEWRFGVGRGLTDFVYVTVSTGIGGGIVSGGRLLHGRMGMAGHIGHMTVMIGGERCSCGNAGCWEAYASGTAFARRIGRSGAAAQDPESVLAAARDGDPQAAGLVAEHGDYLGIGIASLLHLFSPQAVILGGGVSNGLDLLMPAIDRRVRLNAMPAFRDIPVIRAGLGENSGLVGAAALAFDAKKIDAGKPNY